MPLLDLRNLTVEFGRGADALRAVDQVSLSLESGRSLAVVGESGCGKTATAMSIARLLPSPPARYVSGEIWFDGRNTLELGKRELRKLRGGSIGYIFQEPSAALNPVLRIGSQILESLRLHRPEAATESEAVQLLRQVGISAPELRYRDFPHQMSGGMQQRAVIAMALAARPKLLVADEPTTALDVTVQAQILDLLKERKESLGMSLFLITHNLGIVREMADHAAVMYAGQIVEMGPAAEVLRRPLHPYSEALVRSIPKLGGNPSRLPAISGRVPARPDRMRGCRFAPRCPRGRPVCQQSEPPLVEVEPGRAVRCPYWNS